MPRRIAAVDRRIIHAAILVTLVAGVPVTRRQFNALLTVPWHRIFAYLKFLSAADLVRRVGARGASAWTLSRTPDWYVKPRRVAPDRVTAAPTSTSWWTDRDRFYANARARAQACGWTG